MSYSAFKLQVAAADGKSIRNTITQANHNFVAGHVVRYNYTPEGSQGFTLAVADTPEHAEVAGIVESVTDDDTFILVYSGEMNLSTLSLLDTDGVYFLSATDTGNFTPIPPTSGGAVIKPVLTRISDTAGIVTNYLGTIIGGESTVSLESVQPAGVIAPYVGDTSSIPNNWALCDGGYYDRYKYADLYEKINRKYGFRQDIIVASTVNGVSISLDQTLVGGSVVEIRTVNGSSVEIRGTIHSVSSAENKISVNVDSYTQTGVGAGDEIIKWPSGEVYQFNSGSQVAIFNLEGSRVFQSAVPQITSENVTHLRVPDLRGRAVIGTSDAITDAISLTYQLGQVGGYEETSIDMMNLPAHSHGLNGVDIQAQSNVSLIGDVRLRTEIELKSTTGLSTVAHTHFLTAGTDPTSGSSGLQNSANYNKQMAAIKGNGAGSNGDVNFNYALTSTNSPAISGKSSSESPRVVGNLRVQDTSLVNTLAIQNGTINASIAGENTDTAGSNVPFNNLQPYMALNWIIRLTAEHKAALVDLDVSTATTFNGGVTFGSDATVNGTLTATSFNIPAGSTPGSASATGTTGDFAWDDGHLYVCVGTDTWKRTALSTWS